MKYLAILLVAAAAAGAYFYFGSPDFGATALREKNGLPPQRGLPRK